jgi:hypothetical protein
MMLKTTPAMVWVVSAVRVSAVVKRFATTVALDEIASSSRRARYEA